MPKWPLLRRPTRTQRLCARSQGDGEDGRHHYNRDADGDGCADYQTKLGLLPQLESLCVAGAPAEGLCHSVHVGGLVVQSVELVAPVQQQLDVVRHDAPHLLHFGAHHGQPPTGARLLHPLQQRRRKGVLRGERATVQPGGRAAERLRHERQLLQETPRLKLGELGVVDAADTPHHGPGPAATAAGAGRRKGRMPGAVHVKLEGAERPHALRLPAGRRLLPEDFLGQPQHLPGAVVFAALGQHRRAARHR
mmetsp:Transcript_15146/g.49405  ORF Transcript_15146/g.49405 Transcript_15146/m.49405 type:complete len:250 (+) Transcript_15146:290-1039(+)